jgi:hypothetical protein
LNRASGRPPGNTLWSQKDSVVIAYGNAVMDGQHKPLDLLYDFLRRYLVRCDHRRAHPAVLSLHLR